MKTKLSLRVPGGSFFVLTVTVLDLQPILQCPLVWLQQRIKSFSAVLFPFPE
jgi:hypothetical protein